MKPQFFASQREWRAWLVANHSADSEVLVGFHKKSTGKPSLTWSESVDEALCFGWIDGVRRSLGDAAYVIRFTPRKAKSIWSVINVGKVEQLIKAGRMTPAGLRAFESRSAKRTGVYSFERSTAPALTSAEGKELRANKRAAVFFAAQAPSYRRAALHWVVSAKRAVTRERRLVLLITDSAAGRTIPPLSWSGKRPKGTSKA